jgi:hypothetical protein
VTTAARRLAAGAVLLVLVAGCGLPLGGGVREPGQVPDERRQGGDIQVLPPGPRDAASPVDIVRDFYGAQSSPEDGHAIAREFLAPEVRPSWRDNAPVGVLAAPLRIEAGTATGDLSTVRVTGALNAEIAGDGAFLAGRHPVNVEVQLRRGPRGRWLITNVPHGLLLSAGDRERSFRPESIYFLAPPSAPGAAASHLVPDQVFLPVTADDAEGLVRRLIAGPSRLVADSVSTAFPPGTRVRSVRTSASGVVTVDVTEQAGRASAQLREQMSAQLVWTLRGSQQFSKLSFLSAGRLVASGSGGQSVVRDRNDWQSYDPDGLPARPRLYYVSGRRLRQFEPTAQAATDAGTQPVDIAAASPRGGGFALITRTRSGAELRTGPPTGPFALRAAAAALTFPSWGSGEQGVWYLQNGRVRLATLGGRLLDVPVDSIARFGPIAGVRMSRDGARVGLIVGVGQGRRLFVGRVAERAGKLRIVGARLVAPDVKDVRDLTWNSATSLVVLGLAAGVAGPVAVAVDGSSVALVARVGFEGSRPLSVAAAPNQPLVVAAQLDSVPVLYRASGTNIYVRAPGIIGAEPFYPG